MRMRFLALGLVILAGCGKSAAQIKEEAEKALSARENAVKVKEDTGEAERRLKAREDALALKTERDALALKAERDGLEAEKKQKIKDDALKLDRDVLEAEKKVKAEKDAFEDRKNALKLKEDNFEFAGRLKMKEDSLKIREDALQLRENLLKAREKELDYLYPKKKAESAPAYPSHTSRTQASLAQSQYNESYWRRYWAYHGQPYVVRKAIWGY